MKNQQAKLVRLDKYIPQFDGLRAIAILGVLFAHTEYLQSVPHLGFLKYGRAGVDLFFVLSGFLITGILLNTKGSSHYFRNFYARRALRIWPLYFATLFVVFVVILGLRQRAGDNGNDSTWLYYVLYLQNLFPHLNRPAFLAPTWSLALEEQFYMTWPALIFLLTRRKLLVVLVGLMFVPLLFRTALLFSGAPYVAVDEFTLSRLDAIVIGAIWALWLRSANCTQGQWRRWNIGVLGASVAAICLSKLLIHQHSSVLSYSFLATGFAGVLGLSLVSSSTDSLIGRALSMAWFRYLGKISYGIYLLHMPVFIFFEEWRSHWRAVLQTTAEGKLLAAAISFAAVFVIASVSWFLFEQPILRLKDRFRPDEKTGMSESLVSGFPTSDQKAEGRLTA
jgi:peptidoglycan/LPS O-acetylase OafA/YrhL